MIHFGVVPLLSPHVLPCFAQHVSILDFSRLLNNGTTRTTGVPQRVLKHRAFDPLHFPNPPSHDRSNPDADAETIQKPGDEAVLSQNLGVLTNRVARYKKGQDARAEVAEAAKHRVLPLVGHG